MERKPVIVITMGDPAGIGPEIIAKIFDSGEVFHFCKPIVIGDSGVMKKIVEDLKCAVSVHGITSISQADPEKGRLAVLNSNLVDLSSHCWGRPAPASGTAVVAYVKRAVELALRHEADAMVTGPINKAIMNAAGYRYAGHTELLADLTHTERYGMLFVGGGLRVMLATIHVALKDVPKQITTEAVIKALRLAHLSMRFFGLERPRIGVAALNPHAGEGGLFGNEERDVILPAVIKAREEGIQASDPMPADTLFYKARNSHYDVVVAMYHDQGLAPLKMLAFGNAVNVTVGLPIIRTSVDHGTAYDIAGEGCADPASLLQAVKLAAAMTEFARPAARGSK